MLAALLLACVIDRTGQSGTSQLALHAKQIAVLQADAAGIARRVGQLEEITRARGQDEILKMETMEQIRQEVANLRGDVEVLQRGVADATTAGQGFQEDTVARLSAAEARLVALEASLGVAAAPPGGAGAATVTPPAGTGGGATAASPNPTPNGAVTPPPAAVPLTVEETFDRIDAALAEGKPAVARALAKGFLKDNPTHARAAEAAFRVGQSLQDEKDFKAAAASFMSVADSYPDSPWAPAALLRQGDCFDGMGRKEDAKIFYEDVIQRYPKSKAAKTAKSRLGK